MKHRIRRREFFVKMAVTAVGSLCFPRVFFSDTGSRSTVFVVHGSKVSRMLAAGIEKMGGWQAFVKAVEQVVVKPNAAWASLPKHGANTTPELVEACIRACVEAGASEVVVPENPCSPARYAFPRSGIEEAVKRAGGRMYCPSKPDQFRRVGIPRGKSLKEADVVCDVLDCSCLINMPVAKTHASSTLTLSMKNWMGSVKNRGIWHRTGLHQCIADLSTIVKPSLIIMDAMRIMTTRGPRGPGKLAYPHQLVLGTDPVAVDAYSASLFGKKPFDIRHIKFAHDMGVGCGDLTKVHVVHVQT